MEQIKKPYYDDLTRGPITKKLASYSLPYLLTTLSQALVHIIDLVVIGWKGSDASISGVGIGSQLYILILSLAIGLGMGATVIVGQNYDKGKQNLQKLACNIFSIFLAIALLLAILVAIFHNPILRLLQTPNAAFSAARLYTLISIAGIPFAFIFNGQISLLRGVGNSKHPMYIAIIALAINAGLDVLGVFVFDLKEIGIALASVISQIVSVVVASIIIKKGNIGGGKLTFCLDKDKAKSILAVAIPGAIQNSVAALSFLLVTGFVNSIGDAVYASAAGVIVSKYNNFAILPARALSMAISAMIAQNVGREVYHRAKKTFISGTLITFAFGLFFALVTLFFSRGIFTLFNCEERTIEMGIPYLRILSVDYLALPIATSLYGLVNGYGKTNITMITAILTSLVLRVPLAYIFGISLDMGLFGIGLAMPISTIFSAVFIAIIVLAKRKTFLPKDKHQE